MNHGNGKCDAKNKKKLYSQTEKSKLMGGWDRKIEEVRRPKRMKRTSSVLKSQSQWI